MFLLNISVFFISFTGSNAISPGIHSTDSLRKVDDLKDNQRISPEEMNRRRTVTPEKKPEQIEVEQHIQQEKIEQRRERQLNQRRNQQRRQSPSR